MFLVSEMSTALSLLVIGMITVFIVLLLVVITGNLLIWFVNQVANGSNEHDGISPEKIAAITSAVEVATKGKGHIKSIKSIK